MRVFDLGQGGFVRRGIVKHNAFIQACELRALAAVHEAPGLGAGGEGGRKRDEGHVACRQAVGRSACCAQHVDSTLMARSVKGSVQESADTFARDLDSYDSASKRQYVRVIVLAAQASHGGVCAQGGSCGRETIDGNRNAYARAANHDAFLDSAVRDGLSHCKTKSGVVNRVCAVGSEV